MRDNQWKTINQMCNLSFIIKSKMYVTHQNMCHHPTELILLADMENSKKLFTYSCPNGWVLLKVLKPLIKIFKYYLLIPTTIKNVSFTADPFSNFYLMNPCI